MIRAGNPALIISASVVLFIAAAVMLVPSFGGPMTVGSPGEAPRLLLIGLPAVGLAIGWAWIQQIATIEPEVHSFRATARAGRDWLPAVGLVAVAALIGALGWAAVT